VVAFGSKGGSFTNGSIGPVANCKQSMIENDAKQEGSSLKAPFPRNRLAVAALVVVAAIVCGTLAWIGGVPAWGRPDSASVVAMKDQSPAQIAAELMRPGPLPDLVLGRDDAPVTIVEYADLTCPHCAAFHSKVLPLLKEKYIDTGKARLVFREFPLNVHSLVAFMSVRCVPPQDSFPLVAALFSHQEEWSQSRSTKELADKLFAFGQQVGLTRQAFDACVPSGDELTTDQQKHLLRDISAVGDRAERTFGVSSTPTFFVNGQHLPSADIEAFDKAISAALSR
jgi:protein-disulfide isomerase